MSIIDLSVAKALHSARFITEALGHPQLADRATFDAWAHDLSLIQRAGGLRSILVQALDDGDACLYEHAFSFELAGLPGGRLPDSGQGIELPMLARPAAATRLTWTTGPSGDWERDIAGVRGQLVLGWVSGPQRSIQDESSFDSEHHRRITGGRSGATVRVSSGARHTGTIVRSGGRGYCFVHDDDLDRTVFAHARHADQSVRFNLGERLSYVVVTVPKGLQARAILPVSG